MKITRKWLAEYVSVDWDVTRLVEQLTMAGLEAETVEDLGRRLQGVVIGHVLECRQHPDADRLSVCHVDVAEPAPRTIVCGAPNVAAGQKVAVILPGHHLPDGTPIGEARLRGVTSSGMICSEAELDLGTDAAGILVLPDDYPAGVSFAGLAGLDDVVMDFEVTPNRPDCLSVVGIAREVAALARCPLRLPAVDLPQEGPPIETGTGVDIEAPEACHRYVAHVIRGVRVGPSPAWLQNRLRAVGLRPISNVVDITNFVMLELGHPLHAFDLHKLRQRRIVVRHARRGERLQTLDGVEHELDNDLLVIADGEEPVALAGIMGGAATEVGPETTDILLESAWFAPRIVRHGAGRTELRTEASVRFERGADWAMPPVAAARAAALLVEIAGGTVDAGCLDRYPVAHEPRCLPLRPRRVRRLLAADIDGQTCRRILTDLGCRVEQGPEEDLVVTVPSFRPDLEREIDLVEEVGRIHGYHHIEGCARLHGPLPQSAGGAYERARDLRRAFVGLGLDEVVTSSIVDDRWISLLGASACRLANPPAEGTGSLRTSLIPGLFDVARRNFNQRQASVAIFEVGRVFLPRQEAPPREDLLVAGLVAGEASASPWRADRRGVDLLDLKGMLEAVLDPRIQFEAAAQAPHLRSGQGARILLDGECLGTFGQAHRQLCAAFDLDRDVYIFELLGPQVARLGRALEASYTPLPKFPPIERDLAVVLDSSTAAGRVADEIRRAGADLVEHVELFDVYTGDQVEAGKRSLAFSLRLRSARGTLEDGDADRVVDRILKRLGDIFDARLR